MLLLSPTATAAPFTGESSDLPPPPANALQDRAISYHLDAMLAALAELTDWDVTGWPIPQILQFPPEAFRTRTHLFHGLFYGQYDSDTNRVFLNLNCRSTLPESPEAFCRAVLFHELVHWAQSQSGTAKVLSGAEQERQALEYEIRYMETVLGLKDVYPPGAPTRVDLPPLKRPIRLIRLHPRVWTQDAAGRRQWLWIMTGMWMEVPTYKRYHAQAISHRGHWVGVEIFEVNPSMGTQLIEAWWDAGYLPQGPGVTPGKAIPVNPIYQGRWVRLR